jgi:hypothetical protein
MNAATRAKWLEKRGVLTSVRLTDSPSARSYNIISEIEALARGEARGEKPQQGAAGRDKSRDKSRAASAEASAPNSAEQS